MYVRGIFVEHSHEIFPVYCFRIKFPMKFWGIFLNNVPVMLNIGILPDYSMHILRVLHAFFRWIPSRHRRLFNAEKTSSQVAWKTPFFRPVLKDFSGLKKGACKSS